MITIKRKFSFETGRRGRKGVASTVAPAGRVPRVAKLMALAIRLDGLIRDGVVADQAELARLGHVTRARLTQIMNLLCLAPDLQEKLLLLPNVQHGRHPISEHRLRPIASVLDWRKQRKMWRGLLESHSRCHNLQAQS